MYNTQISPVSPAPAPSYPRYSTCPICGDQLYLSRRLYLCKNSISCGYTIPAQLHAETLALDELSAELDQPKMPEEIEAESHHYDTAPETEEARCQAEIRAKRAAHRLTRRRGYASVAY